MSLRKLHLHRHHHHSHGAKSIDYYACQSGLRRWNDGYKVLSACMILVLCIVLDHPWVSVAVIVTMGMVNLWGNRVSLHTYTGLLKIPIAFLVLGSVAIALGVSRQPLGDYNLWLHWGYLYFTKTGIRQALELFLKAMGAVSAMYLMALSTPASNLIGVLKKAHVPKIIVELMNMIYRFIFILTEVQGNMKTAAVSRLGYVDFKTSCYSFGQTAGNLFILSLKKANTYYDAMVSRCYEGDLPFWEEEKPIKAWQIGILALYVAGLLLLTGI